VLIESIYIYYFFLIGFEFAVQFDVFGSADTPTVFRICVPNCVEYDF
jgi:hypothetical protein